jgi:hypothetical protein
MKRSASTEYSIEGGTALLVPPYKTVDWERIPVGRRNYKYSPSLPEKAEGFTMRPYAVLRCKPHRSTYIHIRLAIRFLRTLPLGIFEQP